MADLISGKLKELGLTEFGIQSPQEKMVAHAPAGRPGDAQSPTHIPENEAEEMIARELESILPDFHPHDEPSAAGAPDGFPTPHVTITEEVTKENLFALHRLVIALMSQRKMGEALELARAHEPAFKAAWIDTVPEGMRPISCNNNLQEKLCAYLIDGKPYTTIPRGIDRLYLYMARCSMALGDISSAQSYLVRSLTLNPASVDALLDLEAIETHCCNFDNADSLITQAYMATATTYDLSHVYRRWGYHATRKLEFELAYYCYSYALEIDDGSGAMECVDGIENLKGFGYERTERVDAQDMLSWLEGHGYPVDISDIALAESWKPVDDALAGGPLPDVSYVVARISEKRARREEPGELHTLLLAVTPMFFSMVSISDYLYKPVLLPDYAFTITHEDGTEVPALTHQDETGVVAIPYIDPHAGLMFEAFASYSLTEKTVKTVMPETQRATLSAAGFEHSRFLLLRPQDYPALHADKRAARIINTYATTPERDATRNAPAVDSLRNFANPDDILVVLTRPGVKPEGVWMTLERIDAEGNLFAKLATEPFDDFGMHAGEIYQVKLALHEGTGQLLAFCSRPA